MHKLGVFHANKTSKCLDPHLKGEVGAPLSPPVKYFY